MSSRACGQRNSRLEARHHIQEVRIAVAQSGRRKVNRNPEVHFAVAERELARHDADDRGLQAVDQDIAIDDARRRRHSAAAKARS